ncbi:MAG TPA: cytochrome c3 family protein [Thermoanaerobaculia bacterium]|nr:cytochrome c3 family protein [Thermoanaerobaculia bacterium]HUM28568.1 cytochrome c3 family protein [Thermoanaerobaculia bacterium]HXK66824.1 cytochrome c3 family protein [Thermoanaerobaculia bacterium]
MSTFRNLFVFLLCLLMFAVVVPSMALPNNEECLACHAMEGLEGVTERGKSLNLLVPEDALFGSVHEDLSCTDCHLGPANFDEVPHTKQPMKLGCPECHSDVMEMYHLKDVHGRAVEEGNTMAPFCSGCHGGHDIMPMSSPDSRMSKQNQPDTCGRCHGQEELNLQEGITKRQLIERYKSSVHWEAIQRGKNGASCTDCHGHHSILSSAEQDSTVSRTGVAFVCQKCHPNEALSFIAGAHGQTLEHGNNEVPNCITCHGDHDMASLRERVGDAKNWAATQVCIWCHGNDRMMARYGLDTSPVESYMKDFHGLTQRGTAGASATCADCHDPHHSLPSDHPSSRMHLSNRGAACGKCHGQVTPTFAMSFTHKKALETGGQYFENIIKILYIIIIVISILIMLGHNSIIWLWAVREKNREQKKRKHIRRMTNFEIFSHFILFLTFTTLAFTGFALKFPEAFWVKWLFSIGMTEPIRAFIHRMAAFIMTLDFVFFAIYMAFGRRGRIIFRELLPQKRDLKDTVQTMKYYMGTEEKRPRYAVFNYAEKFEFWALVWGTLIMVVTGFILWFPNTLPGSWPSWIINVARVIHYYEALLATLAIIIWHGFHTVFHPAEYPMSTSWLTGYITDEEAEHHFDERAIMIMQAEPSELNVKKERSGEGDSEDS